MLCLFVLVFLSVLRLFVVCFLGVVVCVSCIVLFVLLGLFCDL